jgi:hypothetical protein
MAFYKDGRALAEAFGGQAKFLDALNEAWRCERDPDNNYEEWFLDVARIRRQADLARNARADAYAAQLDALIAFIEQNSVQVESLHRAQVDFHKASEAFRRAERWVGDRADELMVCKIEAK